MFRRLAKHLEESRKAQAVAAGCAVKVVTMMMGLLAFVYSWQADKLATSHQLVKYVEDFFAELGNLTAAGGALMAVLVAAEDSFHKLGLPWFAPDGVKKPDPSPPSPDSRPARSSGA